MPSSETMQRFDRLLAAMLTKPPFDAQVPEQESEADDDLREDEG